MKEILKNRKGFTLIELLAVIVILAILVMVAIPAITKILTDARKGTFADTALHAIESVRNDYIASGYSDDKTYVIAPDGDLMLSGGTTGEGVLEKKLTNSPFGKKINQAVIKVKFDSTTGTTSYSMCMYDEAGNGFGSAADGFISENAINKSVVKLATPKSCTSS